MMMMIIGLAYYYTELYHYSNNWSKIMRWINYLLFYSIINYKDNNKDVSLKNVLNIKE